VQTQRNEEYVKYLSSDVIFLNKWLAKSGLKENLVSYDAFMLFLTSDVFSMRSLKEKQWPHPVQINVKFYIFV